MRMVNQAEAFGGRWATSALSWLVLLLPATLLVVIQDIETPFTSPLVLLISALAQHMAGGGASLALGSLARWRRATIPVVAVFAIWIIGGAIRGLVGGYFASAYGDTPADYAYRIGFWVTATVVWMPLFTYLFTQLDVRRMLLGELDLIALRIGQEKARARRSAEQLRSELVDAVRDAVAPLVADVQNRLSAAAEHDAEIALDSISSQLESIVNEANAIMREPADPPPQVDGPLPLLHWAPTLEALTFDRSRPLFATALTGVAVASLLLPDSFRNGGLAEAVESLIAVLVGCVVMVVGLFLARRVEKFGVGQAAAIFAFAGIVALVALLSIETYPLDVHDVAVAFTLPVWFTGSAAVLSAEVGIANASRRLLPHLAQQKVELQNLIEHSREREETVKSHVVQLMHGPLLGRLSACIMALNFFMAEPENKRGLRRSATTEGVLAHLQLVSQDLEQLSRSTG